MSRVVTSEPRAFRDRAATIGAWRPDSLVRNSTWVIATTLTNGAIGYVYWALAARSLSTDAIGIATAVIAAMTFVSVATGVGFGPNLVARLPGRHPGTPWSVTVTVALVTGAGLGALGGAAAVVLLPWISDSFDVLAREPALAIAAAAGAAAWTMATITDFVFIAQRRTHLVFGRNVASQTVKLALLAIVISGAVGASTGLVGSWAAASFLSVAFAFAVLVPRLGRSYRPVLTGMRAELARAARSTAGHHLISLGSQLPVYLLPVVVVAQASPEANAFFSVTWMVGSVFFTVSPAVAASLFAEGSHAPDALAHTVRRSARLIALLLAPPAAVMALAGSFILSWFGAAYAAEGSTLLLVLVVSAVPDAVTNVWVAVQRVRGNLRAATALNVTMAVSTLVLAWFLVPKMGIVGAGVAWLAAQSAGALTVGVMSLRSGTHALGVAH